MAVPQPATAIFHDISTRNGFTKHTYACIVNAGAIARSCLMKIYKSLFSPCLLLAAGFLFAGSDGVHAQQLAAYGAPWMDDGVEGAEPSAKQQDDDLQPRHLSLRDVEKLVGSEKRDTQKTPYHPKDSSSRIEDMYSERADEDLEQFGYDLFSHNEKMETGIPAGIVQDDYILSSGDTLDITVRGQENQHKTYTINTRGELVTSEFTTIGASGKTLGDVRKTLQEEAANLHNVEINVSLSGARQIDVLVIGDVLKPGRKTLTPFHTVLDALQNAEGIRKTGSLRRIRLVRNGKSSFIDLYNILMNGASNADQRLQDGDRIIVPPVGPTVAISGAVKRPGIYEIRNGQNLTTLEMLGMAGGVLSPGSNRFMRLTLTSDGRETVEDISEPSKRIFGDGGMLTVAQAQEKRSEDVELSGHTRDPGPHALQKAKTLSELIKSDSVFGDSLYPLIGVIERHDKNSLTRKLIEFSPHQVLQKKSDLSLTEGDVVHLFSIEQIRGLGKTQTEEAAPLLQKVSYSGNDKKAEPITDDMITSFLEERSTFVRGAVRQPGAYPVSADTTLESLVSVAGGTTIEADESNIEVTSRIVPVDEEADAQASNRKKASLSQHDLKIAPGDTVRVNQKFNRVEDQSVTLLGEVKNPGKYDLVPGDTMLSLIQRAGGLTGIAYPDGTIFSRASERRQEEARYKAEARDLELKLASLMRDTTDKDKKPDMAQVNSAQSLIAQLKDAKAVGRITVAANPDVLTSDPDQNMLLEGGDKIYIPRRPLNVRVGGEVLSPAALQFRKGKTAQTYIDEAGGTTYYADRDRAFVVYPDGSAQPLSVSAWKQKITMIPPGSTIIVPRDPKPFDFLDSAEAITNILANIALTGFYLDDLGNDD